jgi:hypothetical protein
MPRARTVRLGGGRPRPDPAAVHEVNRRIEDHLISGFYALSHFDLRSEVARDRYFLDVGDSILHHGHLQAPVIEDDGIRRDQQ